LELLTFLPLISFSQQLGDINKENGEANFDINDESNKIQLDLFEPLKLSKIEQFNKIFVH